MTRSMLIPVGTAPLLLFTTLSACNSGNKNSESHQKLVADHATLEANHQKLEADHKTMETGHEQLKADHDRMMADHRKKK